MHDGPQEGGEKHSLLLESGNDDAGAGRSQEGTAAAGEELLGRARVLTGLGAVCHAACTCFSLVRLLLRIWVWAHGRRACLQRPGGSARRLESSRAL